MPYLVNDRRKNKSGKIKTYQRWMISFRVAGRLQTHHLGACSKMTKDQALEKATRIKILWTAKAPEDSLAGALANEPSDSGALEQETTHEDVRLARRANTQVNVPEDDEAAFKMDGVDEGLAKRGLIEPMLGWNGVTYDET